MRAVLTLLLAAVASTSGATEFLTGNLINPNELQTPSQPSCVELKEPLSFDRRLGLLKILWTLSLAKGPYLTEKQDSQGTYYRAPPGGIFVSDSDSGPSHGRAYDGGFYVPKNGTQPVKIYYYYSEASAPVQPPADFDCSSAGYIKTPGTSKISLVALTAVGAGEGAAAGTIARRVVPSSKLNYAQSAGLGAAGGALGGAVIAGIENAKVGKIYFPSRPTPTSEFSNRLKDLVVGQVPVSETQAPEAAVSGPSSQPAANTN